MFAGFKIQSGIAPTHFADLVDDGWPVFAFEFCVLRAVR